jgi:sugar lactone lactonase YvrE
MRPLAVLMQLVIAGSLFGAGFTSQGFLEFPKSEEIGAMSAVEVDAKGRIYVLHRGPKPVMVFDRQGRHVRSFGDGLFKVAHGLRVDRQGNIWTTDNALHVLRKFSPEGKLLATVGEEGKAGNDETHFRSPDDIVFTSKHEMIVADAGNGRIVRLSTDGKYISSWGKKGKAIGEFAAAHGLAIDKRDRVYVADRGNNRVQVFSIEGKQLGEWKGFGNPFGLLVYGDDLLVSDGDVHRISHLRLTDGSIAAQWGDPQSLQLPHLMARDGKGRLFVAEVNGKRVQIFQYSK